MTQLTLDRPPFGKVEQELVNGFQQVATIEEIWVREVNPMLTGNECSLLRVYLAFSSMDAPSRELADRIEEAYRLRMHYEKMDFEFHHIPYGKIPKSLPCRIWKRVKIWTPTEHRIALAKRGPR